MYPIVVTIAGSDSSGGAGIQADLKAIAANGGYGASIITAITAQNTREVLDADAVSIPLIQHQMQAVFTDLTVSACKSGMLGGEVVIAAVADAIREYRPPHFVCDPVMISKSGYPLLPEDAVQALKDRILPLADLVTPNVHEARAIAGVEIRDRDGAVEAGRRILDLGPKAVLIKGGHLEEDPGTDVLVRADGPTVFEGEWIDSDHTHGTGCTYSSAIATWLAHGRSLVQSVEAAKAYVTEAIRYGLAVGGGTGPTDHFFFLRSDADHTEWLSRLRAVRASD